MSKSATDLPFPFLEEDAMKVVIIHDRMAEKGANPDQLDVLAQAKAVAQALEDLGHESMRLGLTMDFKAFKVQIERLRPDLVFNLVESVEGHGRLIHLAPTLLELLDIPYTGSPADALYETSNKLIAKKALVQAGIRTPATFLPDGSGHRDPAPKGAYIIKSTWEHASIGIDDGSVLLVDDPQELFGEMERRRQGLGGTCFAETYIEGREFNLSLLASQDGPEVLPPAEIRFSEYPGGKWKIVDYRAKWDHASLEYAHTHRSFEFPEGDQPLLFGLATLAKECWELFGLRGYARVDFRVDKDNRPWVLEINANPCLSPDAGFVAAATQRGIDFTLIVERIIHDTGGMRYGV